MNKICNLLLVLATLFTTSAYAAVDVPDDEYVIFYAHDLLGSPVAVSDDKGRVLWLENSQPYGKSLLRFSESGEGFPDNAVPEADTRLGYTGHVADSASSLVYMKARYYDPDVGRFYSNDPVGYSVGNPNFNRYAYVNNNLYTFVDPTGADDEDLLAGGSAGQEQKNAVVEAWESFKSWVGSLGPGNTNESDGFTAGYDADTLVIAAAIEVAPISKLTRAMKEARKFLKFGRRGTGTGAKFSNQSKLNDHYNRHGDDVDAADAEDYQDLVDGFLTGKKDDTTLEIVRDSGDIVRFNTNSEEFGVLSSNGTIRTYYVPDPKVHGYETNLEYFYDQ